MTTETAPSPKASPFERKLTRLQTAHAAAKTELDTVTARRASAVVDSEKAKAAADLALQHIQEDAASADEHALRLIQKRDQLLAELNDVRLQIRAADMRRVEIIQALGAARQHQATCDAALAKAGEPFDQWIAALTVDVEKFQRRVDDHVARGPGSLALFVGVKG